MGFPAIRVERHDGRVIGVQAAHGEHVEDLAGMIWTWLNG
jgi:hypothetical protein